MDAVEAEMAEMERLIFTHPKDLGHEDWSKQRVRAGLTGRQAAAQMQMEPRLLADIENGRVKPTEAQLESMSQTYGCGN